MNKDKQLLEELKRFNQINDYDSSEPTIISEKKGKVTKTLNEQVSTIPGTGSDLSTGIGATTKAPKGAWGKGLPNWIKTGNFVKAGSIAGVGGLVASEASADPGVQAVGNIVGFGGTGAAIGSMIAPGIGTAIGALVGGAAGAVMSSWSEENQALAGGEEAWTLSMNNELWEAFDTIKKKEDLNGLEIISSSEAGKIADKLLTAMYGAGTNENRIIDAIDLAPSLVDVSRVHDKFGIEKGMWPSTFRGDLTEWVEDELSGSELNRFKNQLKNKPVLIYEGNEINTIQDWEDLLVTEKEPSEDDKTALEFAKLWKNYPCVIRTAQVEGADTKWSEDNKQVTIKIGDAMARFSYTGKYTYKGPASNNKVTPVGTYSCSGDELNFDNLDDSDMTIKESRKLSNILKSRKVISEQNTVDFGDMVLNLPEPVGSEKETEEKETIKKTTTVYTTAPSLADVVSGKSQIKQGHQGDSIRAIQSIIGAPVDGKFGPVTYKAVRAYQNGNGLSVTGIVDQQTASLITNAGRPTEKVTTIKKTEEVATDKDEENVNLVAYEMEQTNTEIIDNQINQLNAAIAEQPTKKKCIALIGTAAAGCKMGVKNINKNSLSQCYNSYDFGLSGVGRTGKSRRVKRCYDLKGRGNTAA